MPNIPSAVHIIHTDPVMTAGLHAILADRPELRVSTHLSQPEARQVARVLVADYDTGLALARQPDHGGLRRPSVLIVTQLDKEWEVRLAMDAGTMRVASPRLATDEAPGASSAASRGEEGLGDALALACGCSAVGMSMLVW